MGYELIWQPYKNSWAVWSTIVDEFVREGIQTPDGVADFILGNEEFYYQHDEAGSIRYEKNLDGVMTPSIATCRYKSRMEIVDYYTRALGNVHESRTKTLTKHGWEEKVLSAEQVYNNLENAYIAAIKEWEAGKIFPDPKAKEEIKRYWIEEAERVKREGILTISGVTFKITDEGPEYGSEVTKGPEIW